MEDGAAAGGAALVHGLGHRRAVPGQLEVLEAPPQGLLVAHAEDRAGRREALLAAALRAPRAGTDSASSEWAVSGRSVEVPSLVSRRLPRSSGLSKSPPPAVARSPSLMNA